MLLLHQRAGMKVEGRGISSAGMERKGGWEKMGRMGDEWGEVLWFWDEG